VNNIIALILFIRQLCSLLKVLLTQSKIISNLKNLTDYNKMENKNFYGNTSAPDTR